VQRNRPFVFPKTESFPTRGAGSNGNRTFKKNSHDSCIYGISIVRRRGIDRACQKKTNFSGIERGLRSV